MINDSYSVDCTRIKHMVSFGLSYSSQLLKKTSVCLFWVRPISLLYVGHSEKNAWTHWLTKISCSALVCLWMNRAWRIWREWTDITNIKSDVQQLQRNTQTSLNDQQQLLRGRHQNQTLGKFWFVVFWRAVIKKTSVCLFRVCPISLLYIDHSEKCTNSLVDKN